ncbi:hypothetical protein ANN_01099 [Periplaneta americana]|uniref:Endonuclease/exonuclease/phosphatase domain-containing protein n=1 Tax=Periplaneta americana TaxID=6978 RepID=A0ABQ8TSP1_PERAM|nr:hypothetical protein ANN_01099 [Periplaneta americana]
MSPGSSSGSYPAFARIGLRENPGRNLNQETCLDRDLNPGHLVSRPDALTINEALLKGLYPPRIRDVCRHQREIKGKKQVEGDPSFPVAGAEESCERISRAWKLWIHGEGQQGERVKLTRKASETTLAAPGEEVASPYSPCLWFRSGSTRGGSDFTKDCVHVIESELKKIDPLNRDSIINVFSLHKNETRATNVWGAAAPQPLFESRPCISLSPIPSTYVLAHFAPYICNDCPTRQVAWVALVKPMLKGVREGDAGERHIMKQTNREKKRRLRIGTWNVRTLLQAGKLENLKKEIRRNKVDVIGILEIRWENCGELMNDEFRSFYSNDDNGETNREENGLTVVLVKVYMPHSGLADEEVEESYDKIGEIVEKEKKGACVILMGDWNAVVGLK